MKTVPSARRGGFALREDQRMPPAPLRKVDLGHLEMAIAPKGGALYVRAPAQLETYDAHVTAWLDDWAARAPQRVFLAERDARGKWQDLTK